MLFAVICMRKAKAKRTLSLALAVVMVLVFSATFATEMTVDDLRYTISEFINSLNPNYVEPEPPDTCIDEGQIPEGDETEPPSFDPPMRRFTEKPETVSLHGLTSQTPDLQMVDIHTDLRKQTDYAANAEFVLESVECSGNHYYTFVFSVLVDDRHVDTCFWAGGIKEDGTLDPQYVVTDLLPHLGRVRSIAHNWQMEEYAFVCEQDGQTRVYSTNINAFFDSPKALKYHYTERGVAAINYDYAKRDHNGGGYIAALKQLDCGFTTLSHDLVWEDTRGYRRNADSPQKETTAVFADRRHLLRLYYDQERGEDTLRVFDYAGNYEKTIRWNVGAAEDEYRYRCVGFTRSHVDLYAVFDCIPADGDQSRRTVARMEVSHLFDE